MQWDEVRKLYPNQWVLLDIYTKVEREGFIVPLDMKVVDAISNEGLIVRKARGSLNYLPYHTKHKHISIRNNVK